MTYLDEKATGFSAAQEVASLLATQRQQGRRS
jgi:hypothetical protein